MQKQSIGWIHFEELFLFDGLLIITLNARRFPVNLTTRKIKTLFFDPIFTCIRNSNMNKIVNSFDRMWTENWIE